MTGHKLSISMRLTAWFGIMFLLGLLLFGAAMWGILKTNLTSERQQTLVRRIDRLQDVLRRGEHRNDLERSEDFKDFAAATGNGLMMVFDYDGTPVWPAPSAAARAFPWPASQGPGERFLHVETAGQPYWVVSRPMQWNGREVRLLAAASEAGNNLLLESFWRGLLGAAPVLLVLSMAGGYSASRRALLPVDRITAAARSIGIRNLSERIPVTYSGDELQRLAETSNDMLERLEVAVRKLRQFTADASHELRGPISLTRTIAEVALRQPETDSGSRQAFHEIVAESVKTAEMLENLLELARADGEPIDIVVEAVDLDALLEEGCAMARTLAAGSGVTVQLRKEAAPVVVGHAPSLKRLIWILLDNALKYTPSPGRVEVCLATQGGRAMISVQDTGIGIPASKVPYIFDRFYRVDPSRSGVEGNGLGLSIAKWIADRHRAEIRVTSQAGVGSTFFVVFAV